MLNTDVDIFSNLTLAVAKRFTQYLINTVTVFLRALPGSWYTKYPQHCFIHSVQSCDRYPPLVNMTLLKQFFSLFVTTWYLHEPNIQLWGYLKQNWVICSYLQSIVAFVNQVIFRTNWWQLWLDRAQILQYRWIAVTEILSMCSLHPYNPCRKSSFLGPVWGRACVQGPWGVVYKWLSMLGVVVGYL